MKKCSKCGELKELIAFYKDKREKDGHWNTCKLCEIERSKKWSKDHPKKHAEIVRQWKRKNPDKARESYKRSIEKRKSTPEGRARLSEKNREWHKIHRVRCTEVGKQWRKNHPERAKELGKRASLKRRGTPRGRLNDAIRSNIRNSLKVSKNNRHWEELVGYTIEQLKKHLEKRFKPGMTWDNYGTVWVIDHKIPIAAFNFERPDDIDFRICWSLNNLQPLGPKENAKKGEKLEKPFQPSLTI
ncbi:MAG: hypothetical protein Q8J68_14795 [Methanolobus sp.]|uniref:hypothetical protein n=1 Tax=Methanolobus sp. TaxID=1874737 RepID=UPI0027321D02|nr:hypothetical protein [Methanolobus sp.]MDP2218543.1 hypothetical protein [Methanolobus sp.]